MPDFILRDWCAWSPGFMDSESACVDDRLITSAMINVPANVPKLLHRRLGTLAKAVFSVAERCLSPGQSLPVVFSSSHGEICKSLEMLKIIQKREELSPTAFSLSVHNAIAGLFSIAFVNREEITVIAPCREGIHAAFAEALGQLLEGINEVLIMLYDEPIADFYPTAPYQLTAPQPCVFGAKISLQGSGLAISLSRGAGSCEDGEQPVQLLALLGFLLGQESELTLGNQGHCWTWCKH